MSATAAHPVPRVVAGRYRWVILVVFFITHAICYTAWYGFPVLLVALLRDFGWSRAATSLALSIFVLTNGLSSPIVGALVDRFGSRLVIPGGAALMVLGLWLSSFATQQWQLYLSYGVIAGLGMGGAGWIPTIATLVGWFPRNISTAAGIVSAGIGVGILVLVPTLQKIIEASSWDVGFLILAGAIAVIVLPLNLAFQRTGPFAASRGKASVHEPPDDLVVDRAWARRTWTVAEALKTRRFWALFACQICNSMTIQLVIVHQAAFLVDRGYDLSIGALAAGIIGLSSIGGKLIWGPLSDRFGRETVFSGVSALMPLSLIPLWFATPELGLVLPLTFATIMGLGYAVGATLNPALAADIFRGPHFGAVFGALGISIALGGALGPWLAGFIYDVTGSYFWAFGSVWLATAGSIALVWYAAPRKVRRVPSAVPSAR